MINPQSLDLASLPSVPLAEKDKLPASPGIYFAIDSFSTIQYIGLSVNVKHRWGQHHRYKQLLSLGGIKLAWLIVDNIALLSEIEKALIAHFKPVLNNEFISSTYRTRQSRLATDVWIMGAAISRYLKMSTARDGFEVAVRQYADQLSKDEKFTALLEAIKKETEESLKA